MMRKIVAITDDQQQQQQQAGNSSNLYPHTRSYNEKYSDHPNVGKGDSSKSICCLTGRKPDEDRNKDDISNQSSSNRSIVGCWRIVPRYVFLSDIHEVERAGASQTLSHEYRNQTSKEQHEILTGICKAFRETEIERTATNSSIREKKLPTETIVSDKFTFSLHNNIYKVLYKVEYLSEEINNTLVLTLSATTFELISDNKNTGTGVGTGTGTSGALLDGNKVEKVRTTKEAAVFPNDEIIGGIVQMLTMLTPKYFILKSQIASITSVEIDSNNQQNLSSIQNSTSTSPISEGRGKLTNVVSTLIQNSPTKPTDTFQKNINNNNNKEFLFSIEAANDHYARYLSPQGQTFCNWIYPQVFLKDGNKKESQTSETYFPGKLFPL